MQVRDLTSVIENYAPLSLQESYDNAGLICGSLDNEVSSVLLCTDVTEAVIDEAIAGNFNLIISHHPLSIQPLKNLLPDNWIKRCLIRAIKNELNIYAAHTNMDAVLKGVSGKIADKLELTEREILKKEGKKLLAVYETGQTLSGLEAYPKHRGRGESPAQYKEDIPMEDRKFCQCCGMPLDKPEDAGTEADGTLSGEYCRYCYQNGAFTAPDATMDDMIAFKEALIKAGKGEVSSQKRRKCQGKERIEGRNPWNSYTSQLKGRKSPMRVGVNRPLWQAYTDLRWRRARVIG